MKSLLAFLFLFFSLSLFGNTSVARKDGGEYWGAVMKDHPMPEAIKGLVRVDGEKAKCHDEQPEKLELKEEKIFVDLKTNGVEKITEQTFVKDFEPIPNVSAYGDDKTTEAKKKFTDDFEPWPNVSAYGDDKTTEAKKKFADDFEPRPNVSAYGDDKTTEAKKKFTDDFEPRPNVSTYHE